MTNLPSPDSSSPQSNQWPHPLPSSSLSSSINSTLPPTDQTAPKPNPKPKPKPSESPIPPFRNVSACNRCRIRKHRCDQRLPRCEPCEKAQVRCVGYDPLTKQEVPRSYVAFLESRVNYLNQVLLDHNIAFKPALPYDEEETLKIEAGHRPERGLLEAWREMPESHGLRKRKSPEDAVPARQLKRLAQLNVLLTELITDGCVHGHEERAEQRLPWSPRSLGSVEQGDGRATPESESAESRELDRDVKSGGVGGGVKAGFGLDRGRDGERKILSGIDPGLMDFEAEGKNEGGRLKKTDVGSLDLSSHTVQNGEGRSVEAKFDIAADLLRGRMERQRDKDGFDLLDEFLVDWTE